MDQTALAKITITATSTFTRDDGRLGTCYFADGVAASCTVGTANVFFTTTAGQSQPMLTIAPTL
jgi:hypothetical protein